MEKSVKIRGIIAVIALIIAAAAFVGGVIFALPDAEGIADILGCGGVFALFATDLVAAISHFPEFHDHFKPMLFAPVIGWIIYLFLIIGIPLFFGWLFIIVDLIRYIIAKKKEG